MVGLIGPTNTSGLYYKQVTIVIYNRNDSGLYYKTRDDRNWRRKLRLGSSITIVKVTLQIVALITIVIMTIIIVL